MDAIVAQQKDPWNPEEEIIQDVSQYLSGVKRILTPQGKFLQISFSQPHFREPLLQHLSSEISHESFGDGFENFLYLSQLQLIS